MKNLILNKIKNLTLDQINKNLIFVAILALFLRIGNFAVGFLPKPFEVIVLIIVLLTIIDSVKNNRIKEFFYSVPGNVRIALICLVSSFLIGWGISFLKDIPTTFNMVLEFGTFIFSLSIFLLIIFYSKNNDNYIKWYFYALLIPVLYIIFIIFPELANTLNATDRGIKFIGFTMNPNIISKILFIPTIFFIVKSFFEDKNIFKKFLYILVSSCFVSLMFWTSSRGAILSLVISIIIFFFIFICRDFSFKKLFYSALIIFIIFLLGFVLTPREGKILMANRALSTVIDKNTLIVENTLNVDKNTNIKNINYIDKCHLGDNKINSVCNKVSSELRFRIWYFYLNKIAENPLGYGPNTHMNSYILLPDGSYDNTGPHNSYMQALFWGGILGFLSYLYLLFYIYKDLIKKTNKYFDVISLSLFISLIALSISVFFDDSLHFYWLWIILAISINYKKYD